MAQIVASSFEGDQIIPDNVRGSATQTAGGETLGTEE
jgi:hypothetical protein